MLFVNICLTSTYGWFAALHRGIAGDLWCPPQCGAAGRPWAPPPACPGWPGAAGPAPTARPTPQYTNNIQNYKNCGRYQQ